MNEIYTSEKGNMTYGENIMSTQNMVDISDSEIITQPPPFLRLSCRKNTLLVFFSRSYARSTCKPRY